MDRAGQDDVVVDHFGLDVGARDAAADQFMQSAQIALDQDLEVEQLLAAGVEEEGVRLADLQTDHINAARGADDSVDDIGAGDQHIARIFGQFDDRSLVQRQQQLTRDRSAATGADDQRLRRFGARLRVAVGISGCRQGNSASDRDNRQ
jgi:hypothetical protein